MESSLAREPLNCCGLAAAREPFADAYDWELPPQMVNTPLSPPPRLLNQTRLEVVSGVQ
jgi:hypothetical protein